VGILKFFDQAIFGPRRFRNRSQIGIHIDLYRWINSKKDPFLGVIGIITWFEGKIRGVVPHELSTAISHLGLVDGVENLPSLFPRLDKPRAPEQGEVVGNCGLSDSECSRDFTDGHPLTAAHPQNFLPGAIGQSARES
jgi:hypothetical protein